MRDKKERERDRERGGGGARGGREIYNILRVNLSTSASFYPSCSRARPGFTLVDAPRPPTIWYPHDN